MHLIRIFLVVHKYYLSFAEVAKKEALIWDKIKTWSCCLSWQIIQGNMNRAVQVLDNNRKMGQSYLV
jgi:heterodisulfide reductase subunit B